MLQVQNLGYDSWQTICFQRATVVASELVLAYALQRYMKTKIGWNIIDVPNQIRLRVYQILQACLSCCGAIDPSVPSFFNY
jgi:hypothetical protein